MKPHEPFLFASLFPHSLLLVQWTCAIYLLVNRLYRTRYTSNYKLKAINKIGHTRPGVSETKSGIFPRHVRESSRGGFFFKNKQRLRLDKIGHKSGQKRVHGRQSRALSKLRLDDQTYLGVLLPKSGKLLMPPLIRPLLLCYLLKKLGFLKKNQNAPRPSEHPPVRKEKCQNV